MFSYLSPRFLEVNIGSCDSINIIIVACLNPLTIKRVCIAAVAIYFDFDYLACIYVCADSALRLGCSLLKIATNGFRATKEWGNGDSPETTVFKRFCVKTSGKVNNYSYASSSANCGGIMLLYPV